MERWSSIFSTFNRARQEYQHDSVVLLFTRRPYTDPFSCVGKPFDEVLSHLIERDRTGVYVIGDPYDDGTLVAWAQDHWCSCPHPHSHQPIDWESVCPLVDDCDCFRRYDNKTNRKRNQRHYLERDILDTIRTYKCRHVYCLIVNPQNQIRQVDRGYDITYNRQNQGQPLLTPVYTDQPLPPPLELPREPQTTPMSVEPIEPQPPIPSTARFNGTTVSLITFAVFVIIVLIIYVSLSA